MNERTWTDQPSVCELADVIVTVKVGDNHHCEIRRGPTTQHDEHGQLPYLLTFGNLFGSQTLRVWGAENALRLLGHASTSRDKKLPDYAELLDE